MFNATFFPPEYRGKYPHMFPKDIAVWERFLDEHGQLYEGFYYDVKVGRKARVPKHWRPEYKKDAMVLSRLRIDAIGVTPGSYHLIEVKPKATAAAIGQLLTYKHHFESDYSPERSVQPLLLAAEFDPNLYPLLAQNGIAYIKI